jgi:hypothetical protein
MTTDNSELVVYIVDALFHFVNFFFCGFIEMNDSL